MKTIAEIPLVDPHVTEVARFCKAAGDPFRIDILKALAMNSYGVLELSQAFETQQSGMSHHLKILARAGLVAFRREGNSIFYRRAPALPDDALASLKRELFASIDATPMDDKLVQRLYEIYLSRAQISQRFFVENADKFRKQQDLIASYPVYAEQVIEILDQTPVPAFGKVLEVGPGEGQFLSVLSSRFKQVVALDNAAKMLAKSVKYAEEQNLKNIEFICDDTSYVAHLVNHFDCVVINMVLHHSPSPSQIFQDASTTLKSGGALLVTDLCHHDQHWAESACGDLWMGFEPEDITRWAADADLCDGQSTYFALRNGFQIQIRQFFKHHSPA